MHTTCKPSHERVFSYCLEYVMPLLRRFSLLAAMSCVSAQLQRINCMVTQLEKNPPARLWKYIEIYVSCFLPNEICCSPFQLKLIKFILLGRYLGENLVW